MTGHTYGPHRSEDARTLITIGAGPHAREVPVHRDVLRQREQLNQLAAGRAGVTSLTAARQARDAGQSLASAAHPDERARVEAAIRQLAATGQEFSANQARSLHGVAGPVVGAAFTAARKAGLIRAVGFTTSTEPGTHAHPVRTWVGVA